MSLARNVQYRTAVRFGALVTAMFVGILLTAARREVVCGFDAAPTDLDNFAVQTAPFNGSGEFRHPVSKTAARFETVERSPSVSVGKADTEKEKI